MVSTDDKADHWIKEFDSSLMKNHTPRFEEIETFIENNSDSLDVNKFLDRMYEHYKKHKNKLDETTTQRVFEFFTKHMYPDLKSTYLADVFEDYVKKNKSKDDFEYLLNKIACFMREQDKTSMFNIWNSKVSDALFEKMNRIYNKWWGCMKENFAAFRFINDWFDQFDTVGHRWYYAKCSNSSVKQEIPQHIMKMISRPQRYISKYKNLRY